MNDLNENELHELKKAIKISFCNVPKNYKQKLVYNLLNSIKADDRKRFLDALFRVINAYSKYKEFQELSICLNSLDEKINTPNFEKLSNSIVLAIMATPNITNGEVVING